MAFLTVGMFILDEFVFADEPSSLARNPMPLQIGGGGTYAIIGARMFLPPNRLGMIVDRGLADFPPEIVQRLNEYGDMFVYRDQPSGTTRGLNTYRDGRRNFEYLTPRTRITLADFKGTRVERAKTVHMICSPERALALLSEIGDRKDWHPVTIYEPIPDRCVPECLPALIAALPLIHVLSPNAEEAMGLLSMPLPETKQSIETSADKFLQLGVGPSGDGAIVIRSGALGAYVSTRAHGGRWLKAFWEGDAEKIVDVTGCGNSFLGGLAAGIASSQDIYESALWGNVASSLVLEQFGLPKIVVDHDGMEKWNGDLPMRRVEELRGRH